MTTSLGLCQNVDHCTIAAKKRAIATDIDQPFVCPECHGALVAPPAAQQPARRGFAMVTTASVSVLALAGLGVGWSMRNGSAPAITPAIASTPVATAAAVPLPAASKPVATVAPAEAASVPAIAAPAPAKAQIAMATPAPEQPAKLPPPVAPSSAAVLFRLNGATAMQLQLMPKLAAAYLTNVGDGAVAETKDAAGHQITVTGSRGSAREQIVIDASSSNQSFVSLQDKSSDIAVSTRHIRPAETQSIAAVDAQGEPHEAVIALDGIAIVVNSANAVSTLTLDQLRGIYSGSITNWSQVGGAPLPIRLWTRNESSGTYDLFNSVALRGTAMTSRARPSDDDAEIANNVAQDEGAIGYVSQAHIGLSKAVAIAANGTAFTRPSAASIATEEYPFTRRLYIYTPAAATNSFAARFADFVQSAPGQAIVEQAGFVPLTIRETKVAVPAAAPAPVRQALAGATQLSVAFRFLPNSTTLDSRGVRDVKRMVGVIAADHIDPSRLVLCGFTDTQGTVESNTALAQRRADAVAAAFKAAGIAPVKVLSFGSDLPVADNSTFDGREKNRRVEIYLQAAHS